MQEPSKLVKTIKQKPAEFVAQVDDGEESKHSSDRLSQEVADNVMQLPDVVLEEGASDSKVIETKTICYCSNFDLNVNEWFNEYENIEIFKLNLRKNLGKF